MNTDRFIYMREAHRHRLVVCLGGLLLASALSANVSWGCELEKVADLAEYERTVPFLSTPLGRLTQLQILLDNPSQSTITAQAVYRSPHIVPENGVVHVVGPDFTFYEWFLPLATRPDVQVVVSDRMGIVRRMAENPLIILRQIEKNNPELLVFLDLSRPQKSKLMILPDVRNTHFHERPVPKADLLFARHPSGTAYQYKHHLKPGSLVWSSSRQGDIPTNAIAIDTPLADFFPAQNDPWDSKGTFGGVPVEGGQPYIFVVP